MEISIFDPLYLNEIGGRENNEDRIYPAGFTSYSSRIFMVCDGVGGAPGGEIVATIVCDSIPNYFLKNQANIDEEHFVHALRYAEEQLSDFADRHKEMAGMCTTMTFLGIGNKGVLLSWIGDSKIFHIRKGKLLFQSKDHSLVQEKIDNGELTEAEATDFAFKNIITRVVGPGSSPVEPELTWLTDVQKGDYFFLVSDGILQSISVQEIAQMCQENEDDQKIFQTIKMRCAENSSDNYSMYMIRIESIE